MPAASDQLRCTCPGSGVVPSAVEEGLEAMTRGEHAVISCSREAAAAPGADSLVPSPPGTSDRVEFELTLESMIQVLTPNIHARG